MKISFGGVTIGAFEIRWYGVLIALGVLSGVLVAMRREKRLGLPKDAALNIALIGVPSAIVGARLYYVAFRFQDYAANLWDIFNLRGGGLAIYGGVIGGVAAGYIYARAAKISFPLLADLAAPSLCLGQAIGRWGNFFNQEAYGVALQNPALHFFPVGVYIPADGLWHAAAFFYESAWCFGTVAFLLIAERKNFFRRKGDVFLWYMLLYGLERALVENLRTDSLYLGNIRVSALLSALAVVLAAVLFLLRAKTPWRKIRCAVCALGFASLAAIGFQVGALLFALLTISACLMVYADGHNGPTPEKISE